jgi:capsular polysaccharide biosynthesis protein
LEEVDYYLVPDLALRFQVETLDLLEIRPEARISSRLKPHIEADSLIVTTHPRPNVDNVPSWIVEWLRTTFQDSRNSPHGRLLYISRGDAMRRRLLNEAECFLEVLKPLGFEFHQLSGAPLSGQIELFSEAETVVSVHGAALTNLAFCNPGTKVVELFAAPWKLKMFENMASTCGLHYYSAVSDDYLRDVPPKDASFRLKPKRLRKILAKLSEGHCA